jgi:hypothetical protein
MTETHAPCCLWCNCPIVPGRRRGSLQRFCCPAHRQQFWSPARRWAVRAIETGQLSVDALIGED